MINTKKTDILKVSGMKCHNCAGRVEKELRSLAGVYEANVDLAAKTVTVVYDATQVDSVRMAAAIDNLSHGYKVIQE